MDGSHQSNIHGALKLFIKTDKLHRAVIESKVNRFGLHRSQHIMLMFLARRETPPTQAQIAKEFEISPAAVTATLKKLEAAGLVERITQDGNCRANDIIITESGRKIISESEKFFTDIEIAMFEGISDEEINAFKSCMERMRSNLDSLMPGYDDDAASDNSEKRG